MSYVKINCCDVLETKTKKMKSFSTTMSLLRVPLLVSGILCVPIVLVVLWVSLVSRDDINHENYAFRVVNFVSAYNDCKESSLSLLTAIKLKNCASIFEFIGDYRMAEQAYSLLKDDFARSRVLFFDGRTMESEKLLRTNILNKGNGDIFAHRFLFTILRDTGRNRQAIESIEIAVKDIVASYGIKIPLESLLSRLDDRRLDDQFTYSFFRIGDNDLKRILAELLIKRSVELLKMGESDSAFIDAERASKIWVYDRHFSRSASNHFSLIQLIRCKISIHPRIDFSKELSKAWEFVDIAEKKKWGTTSFEDYTSERADFEMQIGDRVAAQKTYTKLMYHEEKFADGFPWLYLYSRLKYAQLLVSMNQFDQVEPILSKINLQQPELADGYYLQGQKFFFDGHFGKSLEMVQLSLSKRVFYPEALLLRAKIYLKTNRIDALSDLKEIISRTNSNHPVRNQAEKLMLSPK
jgi:tetratricopeptide (TPR) repeat protein